MVFWDVNKRFLCLGNKFTRVFSVVVAIVRFWMKNNELNTWTGARSGEQINFVENAFAILCTAYIHLSPQP